MALPLLALSIDVNGVGTILPAIQQTFDLQSDQLGWVINASTLAFAAVLIPVGRVVPRFGPRRLLLVGVTGFGLMSLICGIAPSFGVLVAARAGQGVASALCFTTSLAVVDVVFDQRRRAAAIGVWGSVSGLGGAIGPLVGGAVTTWWSWRGFFFVNVPLCLVAVPVIAALTPADSRRRGPSVPWPRLVALSGSFVCLIGGLQYGAATSWTSPATLVQFGAGAALLAALGVERRKGSSTLLPAVTGSPLFRPASVVAFCSTWGFGVTVLAMGIYLQDDLGLSALDAGLAFTSFSVTFAIAGAVSGRLVRGQGVVATMGLAMGVAAVGLGAQVVVAPSADLVLVVGALMVGGFGQGLAFDASTTASLEGVPDEAAAEASGVVQTLRLLGLSVGVALAATIDAGTDPGRLGADGVQIVMGLAGVVAVAALAYCLRSTRRASRQDRSTGSVAG